MTKTSNNSRVLLNKKLIAIGTASNLATKVLNITVLVWLNQYLLRKIGADEYSLYPVTVALMAFGPILTTLLNSGLGRYAVSAYAKDDEEEVTTLVSTMFPPLVGIGVLVTLAGVIVAWQVDRILSIKPEQVSEVRWMVGLMFATLAIRFPLAPFSTGMFMRQRYDLDNLISVGCDLLRIGLLLALITACGPRIVWVVLAMSIADWTRLLIRNTISRRFVPALRFRMSSIEWSRAREILAFGSWSLLGKAADTIRTSADPLILNRWAGSFEVSCFYIGSMVASQIASTSGIVLTPLQPALIAMDATQDEKRLRSTFLRSGRYGLWAAMLIAAPLIVFHREVITLYVGSTFAKAGTVMVMMLMLLPIAFAGVLSPNLAFAKAKVRRMAINDTITQVANLLLTLFLVGGMKWGAVGSATATLITNGLGGVFLYWPLGLRLADVSLRRWLKETLLPGLIPALGTIIFLELVRAAHPPNGWIMLGGYALFGILFYLGLVIRIMRPTDRNLVKLAITSMRRLIAGCMTGRAGA